MRYRRKANHHVTIEAMRLPAINEDASDALVEWLGTIPCFSDYDGGLSIEMPDCETLRVEPEEWVVKNAAGFIGRMSNEEFEGEYEPTP